MAGMLVWGGPVLMPYVASHHQDTVDPAFLFLFLSLFRQQQQTDEMNIEYHIEIASVCFSLVVKLASVSLTV